MKLNLVSEAEISQLRDIVAEAERVLVLGHTNPDGDAIGSTLTWAEYMRQQGKEATVVVPDMFPDFLHWLPGSETIVRYDKRPELVEKLFAECDTIFCLDFNVPSRITETLGEMLVKAPGKKVLIDHHLDPDVPTVLTISRPEMSSTSEMVFRLIYQLGGYEMMTHKMAVTAYCGMMTDTGGFTFNSSRPEIFYIISLLLEKGIDKDKIYRNVFNNFSDYRLRLVGYVLYEKLRILTISLREDTDKQNTIWVSLRSVDDFPCNEMAAQFFNGGGHKNASGGRLYCSVEEAEKIVKKAVKAFAELL